MVIIPTTGVKTESTRKLKRCCFPEQVYCWSNLLEMSNYSTEFANRDQLHMLDIYGRPFGYALLAHLLHDRKCTSQNAGEYFSDLGIVWKVLEVRYGVDNDDVFQALMRADGEKCYKFFINPYEDEPRDRIEKMGSPVPCSTKLNCKN
ncbi:hypothetical protein CRM22_003228 [Opisthorchis felineus]|uniref:Uncharacterized protein n=1 Tax=Opisthorchis felineus TaxID=147828 RepID=A0A4V3SFY9_OPIFE|nr:hypothetical protein CRM22_003228 [Opisthorchis felineus]